MYNKAGVNIGTLEDLRDAINNVHLGKNKCYFKKGFENICYLDENSEVPFIRFCIFDDFNWLNFGFSTRLGGVSEGCFKSLNFGYDRGDKNFNVRENYRRTCRALGGDYKKLVLSDQIHETRVEYVDKNFTAGEAIEKKFIGVDGMVTDKKGLILATSYADCVPLFFVDTAKRVIGSSHSGWRGTVGMIGRKTVEKMEILFKSRPEDIICVVGPSICQNCYEVSGDVIDEIKKAYPNETWEDIFYKKDDVNNKYQLDLWAANYHQMRLAGLREDNIYVSGLCTCCNSSVLYSHRASNGKRGNLNGFIMLKE